MGYQIGPAIHQYGLMAEFKVDAVELESGTFIQGITIGERRMLIPPVRDRGQAERLSAELRALLERVRSLQERDPSTRSE
jgi:hypothetical protein